MTPDTELSRSTDVLVGNRYRCIEQRIASSMGHHTTLPVGGDGHRVSAALCLMAALARIRSTVVRFERLHDVRLRTREKDRQFIMHGKGSDSNKYDRVCEEEQMMSMIGHVLNFL
jgi:hypothetical protein